MPSSDKLWFSGSVLLLANWPITRIAIMPVNRPLMAMQEDQTNAQSRSR